MVQRPTQRDFEILARTLYAEARDQANARNGNLGMIAVGAVIMNRFLSNYGGAKTIADVCLAPKQFSCWNGGDANYHQIKEGGTIREPAEMQRAYEVARQILSGNYKDPTGGALYYHTIGVNPSWNRDMAQTNLIGSHRFFRPQSQQNLAQRAQNFFGGLWNGTRQGLQNIGNAIGNAWQGTTQFFRGAYEGMGQGIANIGSAVGNFARRAVNTVGLGAFVLDGARPQVYSANFVGPLSQGARREDIVHRYVAENLDDARYVYGGKNPDGPGLDCSGFISALFRGVFKTEIASPARDQAADIARRWGLPKFEKRGSQIIAADIPRHAVISVQRGGSAHAILVTQDEYGNTVTWDSQGGSRNTAANPGRGVTEGSLESLVRRLQREGGANIVITDTSKLFADLNSGNSLALTQQMLANAWQADLEIKKAVMRETFANSGINADGLILNFTNELNAKALINRSTFMVNSGTGQPILNIAAGMSENWTKFSVVRHIAKAQGLDASRALAQVANNDPAFAQFMAQPELQKYGYGRNFARMVAQEQTKMQGRGQSVTFNQNAGMQMARKNMTDLMTRRAAPTQDYNLADLNQRYSAERQVAQQQFHNPPPVSAVP